ncbi:hypothetical protein [Sphingomonas sp. Leaf4]|uniref:hypothetical protein n=1 Tax=Sphingomonas sp. Leaf4 TaxID=2876553 RepID=UPI001E4AB603|nr:hypothetical protein [Sphingomonas sp. Leaf4]
MRGIALPLVCMALAGCSGPPPESCIARERDWPLQSGLMRGIDPVLVRIRVERDGRIVFNGQASTPAQVARYVRLLDRQRPPPAVRLDVDGRAPCEAGERVRRMLDGAAMCRDGYCGERGAWEWGYGPPVAPPG